MIYRIIIAVLLLLAAEASCSAQSKAVSGLVLDGLTSEPVVYAGVGLAGTTKGVFTDEEGYFYLELTATEFSSKDELTLRVQHLSYPDTLLKYKFSELESEPLRIILVSDLLLPTVDVRASARRNGLSGSVVTPDVEALKRVPALLGETDVLKALTLLPGISTGLEGTANLQIRGGNPSQTNVLIDGVSLYNTGHFGGFLSSIDPYGVKAITVYKGGIPARFGGRLSGVLDIDIRDGRKKDQRSEISVGTATLRAGTEGHIGEKGKYLATGRFSYPSLIVNAFRIGNFKKGEKGNKTVASMYDTMLKTTWDLNKGKLNTLLFVSGDYGTLQNQSGFTLFVDEYNWRTTVAASTYERLLSPDLNWKSSVSASSYRYGYSSSTKEGTQTDMPVTDKLEQQSKLSDLNLATELKWYLSSRLSTAGGITVTNHHFRNTASESQNGDDLEAILDDEDSGLEYAAFGQLDYLSLNSRLKIMTGLRVSGLKGAGKAFNLEPRASVSLGLTEWFFLNAGFDQNTQFVHQLTTSNSILPSDVWILANDQFVPSRASQVYAGFALGTNDGNLTFSTEVFTKKMQRLITLRDRSRDLFSIPTGWRETISPNGEGEVQGLESYLKYTGRRLSGWVAYTYSSSNRRYGEINEGKWFPYTYDRTHDGSITLQYKMNKGWTIGSTFIYQTGHAVTFPVAAGADYFIFKDVNNARIPDYHRLDFNASRTFPGRKNPNTLHTIVLGVYNFYNRANPIDFRLQPTSRRGIEPVTGQTVLVDGFQLRQRSLFPIVPSISYKWEFK